MWRLRENRTIFCQEGLGTAINPNKLLFARIRRKVSQRRQKKRRGDLADPTPLLLAGSSEQAGRIQAPRTQRAEPQETLMKNHQTRVQQILSRTKGIRAAGRRPGRKWEPWSCWCIGWQEKFGTTGANQISRLFVSSRLCYRVLPAPDCRLLWRLGDKPSPHRAPYSDFKGPCATESRP